MAVELSVRSAKSSASISHRAGKSSEMALRILEVSSRQHGLVTRSQLELAGVPRGYIEWARQRFGLLNVQEGVYAVGRPITETREFWMAGVLVAGPKAVLARQSAVDLWGIGGRRRFRNLTVDVLRPESRKPQVTLIRGPGAPRAHRLWVRRSSKMPDQHLTTVDGIPVLTVERLLLDQAGRIPPGRLELLFLESDRLGLLDDDRLGEIFEFGRHWPGIRHLKRLAQVRDPRVQQTKSALEAVFVARRAVTGLPGPEVNKVVGTCEVDFVWEEAKLIVEADGKEYHQGRAQAVRDVHKENYLRRLGYEVLRITWHETKDRLDETVELIESYLSRRLTLSRSVRADGEVSEPSADPNADGPERTDRHRADSD